MYGTNMDALISLVRWLPAEIAVFVIAMTPIAELRGAIPLGMSLYGLDPAVAATYAIMGNMIPPLVLVYFLTPVTVYAERRFTWTRTFFAWLHTRTRRVFSGRYATFGAVALILFVAVPLPFTGAWTGSVAAVLFEIPRRRSLAYILTGVIISATIVTIITTGATKLVQGS